MVGVPPVEPEPAAALPAVEALSEPPPQAASAPAAAPAPTSFMKLRREIFFMVDFLSCWFVYRVWLCRQEVRRQPLTAPTMMPLT